MCNINVFLKARAQYNWRHYSSCISYGVNHLNKINSKTN